jgi:hypothetical protein
MLYDGLGCESWVEMTLYIVGWICSASAALQYIRTHWQAYRYQNHSEFDWNLNFITLHTGLDFNFVSISLVICKASAICTRVLQLTRLQNCVLLN